MQKSGPFPRRRRGAPARGVPCAGWGVGRIAPGLAPAALLAALLAACGGGEGEFAPVEFEEPQTTVRYEAELEGVPSEDVGDLARASLDVWRYQEDGAASLAFLRRRAEGDVETLLRILRSEGHYTPEVEVTVEEVGGEEAEGEEAEGEVEGQEAGEDREIAAKVTFDIDAGPAFTLERHEFDVAHEGPVPPPELEAERLGSPVGKQARAAAIADAENAAVARLKRHGFAYAGFEGRSGVADPEDATLTVTSRLAAGRAYVFGELGFEGVESVEQDYLRSYVPWAPGDTFDVERVRTYQQRLFATELFEAVSVRPPEEAPEGEALPITVAADERPPRTIAGGLRYDTDLGPAVRASFEHRNLFGRNERFLAEADVGLVEQRVGFGVRKPQFLQPGQELVSDLTFTRTRDEAFDAETVTGFAGLERQVTRRWKGGLGGLVEWSEVEDGVSGTSLLLGVPFFADYDGSNDLLNPTRGGRFRIDATPFGGSFDGSDTEFLVLDARGSHYLPLDEDRDYVVATRGRAATILAPELADIPPNRRLYSGGGGSVRGYQERFVGPLDDDDPVGGRSALEAGLEFRARIWGDIGGVVFTEAGSVSTEMFPDFEEGVQVAAGVGLRYHTIAGPIRLDVAFPLNARDADNAFEVYFSIGQAF